MNADDRKAIVEKYSKRLKEHGYSPKALGWDKGRHILRFHVLLSQWPLAGKSILDFGCGFGDLYGYLQELGINARYKGVDLNEELIAEGRRQFPQADLEAVDLLARPPKERYDIVLASGVFNTKISENTAFVERTFAAFHEWSTLGFAANFLSDRVDYRHDDLFYTDPQSVLALAYRHSRRVVLRNDYMPFEFTVFVDKRESFAKELAVFDEFTHLVRPPKGT